MTSINRHDDTDSSADPLRLYLPGPVTTDRRTRQAMTRDWGVWDGEFRDITQRVRDYIWKIAGGTDTYSCVLVQGSGSFGVEAMVQTFLPRDGRLLIPVNGKYGERIVSICEKAGRDHLVLTVPEGESVAAGAVDRALADNPSVTHVILVHCETSTGTLNPVDDIARVTAERGRKFLLDAVSTFGAFDLDADRLGYEALATSPNKCLEGVPGCAMVVADVAALRKAAGNAVSHSLDLADQWSHFETTGQWRFTPPTFVAAALDEALRLHEAEGGCPARLERYRRNHHALAEAMEKLGFVPLVARSQQAPVVISYHCPADANFEFDRFYGRLRELGFMIFPGHLTDVPTFRVACIGALNTADMHDLADAIRQVCDELSVTDFSPATR
ncbi:MAG: 2-aminoethylphosphonate--pyruvate transaminase [Alphaproteobacteria bacterium]|nr:2-aminoethylphosphonate--pyruvate transaminase [Alphaproteobacteria bacterium]